MALRPGNHDRAWNDPPVLAYTANAQKSDDGNPVANPRRSLLNKRVAFPLSGGASPSAPLSASGPPPFGIPPPMSYPIVQSSSAGIASAPQSAQQVLIENSAEASLTKVKNVLEQKSCDINFQLSIREEISKQIHKLLTSWETGKLNEDIQQRLVKLCVALEGGDYSQAECVQIALAVDYTSECSTWILAIKNIITELKIS